MVKSPLASYRSSDPLSSPLFNNLAMTKLILSVNSINKAERARLYCCVAPLYPPRLKMSHRVTPRLNVLVTAVGTIFFRALSAKLHNLLYHLSSNLETARAAETNALAAKSTSCSRCAAVTVTSVTSPYLEALQGQ